MGKGKNEPLFTSIVEPPEGRLERCRALIFFVFERALGDILGERTVPADRRSARAWLASDSFEPYSARWWSEVAELEWVYDACRKIIKDVDHAESRDLRSQTNFRIATLKREWYGRNMGAALRRVRKRVTVKLVA